MTAPKGGYVRGVGASKVTPALFSSHHVGEKRVLVPGPLASDGVYAIKATRSVAFFEELNTLVPPRHAWMTMIMRYAWPYRCRTKKQFKRWLKDQKRAWKRARGRA